MYCPIVIFVLKGQSGVTLFYPVVIFILTGHDRVTLCFVLSLVFS